jgi:Na+/proline symporter
MFKLTLLDIGIIVGFLVAVVGVGAAAARRSSRSASDYFLSGRSMPWWLLGISMVACTFSCGPPHLIPDIVRNAGVAGNWVWWAFLLTGMLTVFVYAKLWRRSELDTDLGSTSCVTAAARRRRCADFAHCTSVSSST